MGQQLFDSMVVPPTTVLQPLQYRYVAKGLFGRTTIVSAGGSRGTEEYLDLFQIIGDAIEAGDIPGVSGSAIEAFTYTPSTGVLEIETSSGDFSVTLPANIESRLTALEGASTSSTNKYEATPIVAVTDLGCFVKADVAGITYSRIGGTSTNTEGILVLPSATMSVEKVSIHFSTAQAPGSEFFLNVDIPSDAPVTNASLDTLMPALATVTIKPSTALSDSNPALNYVHSGTPLQVGVVGFTVTAGVKTRVRYKIANYNQQVGSSASILTFYGLY